MTFDRRSPKLLEAGMPWTDPRTGITQNMKRKKKKPNKVKWLKEMSRERVKPSGTKIVPNKKKDFRTKEKPVED